MTNLIERLGVCSWSLQPNGIDALIRDLQTLNLRRVQIDLDAIRQNPASWANVTGNFQKNKIHCDSGMFRCVGEDYSTRESIQQTGGVVPDETWQDTWEVAQAAAKLAGELRLKLVTFHAGFIPDDETDPIFEKLLHRIRLVADVFGANGVDIGLETGQETASTLQRFLTQLGRVNVGVNFDPANMLILDMGDPTDALEILRPWIRQCHLKDGVRPSQSGGKGAEAVVGTGEVDWPDFLSALRELNIPGGYFFEREAGNSRLPDIKAGRDFVIRSIERA